MFYYKYYNFAVKNLAPFIPLRYADDIERIIPAVFPVGISFIVFQRISYLIDIYRKSVKPAFNLLHYSTYATVFPHLISGPIVRYVNIKKELSKRIYKKSYIFDGFKYFVIGLGLKVFIADGLFIVEKLLKENLLTNNSFESIILILYFSLRLYLDFTGYSLMAIGIAKFMGLNFPYNFHSPYRSSSFQEFWSRWNITLSNWLRDYVYIPLGGNRLGKNRTYLNLILTMLLGGLWHGANWNFLIWGGLHGIYLSIERIIIHHKVSINAPGILKKTFVFIIISFTWLTFIFSTSREVYVVLRSLFSFDMGNISPQIYSAFFFSLPALILAVLWSFYFTEKDIERIKCTFRNNFLLIILFLILLEITLNKQGVPFIYFQF